MSGQFEPLSHQPMPTLGAMDSHPHKPLGTVQHCGSPDNQQLADYLESIAAGDRARFEALYQLTASRLWAVVRRMVVHKQSAEDVLQETYLTIWRKAHLFDRTAGEALGWMTTVARHRAIAWLREPGNATRNACVVLAPQSDLEAIAVDAPEPSVLSNELLEKLSWEQRESLLLVYLCGPTQEEVSIAPKCATRHHQEPGSSGIDRTQGSVGLMSKYDADIAAGEYVLGILSPEQRHRFEERLENEPALREQVARWEVLLSRLERDDQAAPPADLWPRVERALDQQAAASPFHTVRQDDGEWMLIRPGLERKLLYRDPTTGTGSYLFRMKPGALIEGHHHATAEECLILEGDLTIGDLRLNAGDYHVAEVGTIHPVLRSYGGAVMFVRGVSL